MASVQALVQSGVSTEHRKCHAISLRALQASVLLELFGVAREQCLHRLPAPDKGRSCSASQALGRCPPHIDRSSIAPKALPAVSARTTSVHSPPSPPPNQ